VTQNSVAPAPIDVLVLDQPIQTARDQRLKFGLSLRLISGNKDQGGDRSRG
jgi:hypothetical protein